MTDALTMFMAGGASSFVMMQMLPWLTWFLRIVLPIVGNIFGFAVYRIRGTKVEKFQKLIKLQSGSDVEGKPEGYVVGYWFAGYCEQYTEQKEFVIFCHASLLLKLKKTPSREGSDNQTFESLNEGKADMSKVEEPEKAINRYYREGTFNYLTYSGQDFYPKRIIANEKQTVAIDAMMSEYKSSESEKSRVPKEYCVSLFTGPPGTGKSSIALLLATTLRKTHNEVTFVDTFCPTDPGDSFDNMYNKVCPTKENPLVVVLEEVDNIVVRLRPDSLNKIEQHKYVNVLIRDKATWNSFFDAFDQGRYRHVYLVMTSNKSIDWFNSEDSSFIRDGRVNVKMEITK